MSTTLSLPDDAVPDRDDVAPLRALPPVPAAAPLPLPTETPANAKPRRGLFARRAPRPPQGWGARWLVGISWPWFIAIVLGAGLLLAVVSAADTVLVKSAFDPLIGELEVFSWMVAVATAVLAALAALEAGRLMRKHRASGEITVAGPVATIAGWALVGLGLFVLRWKGAGLTAPQVVFEGSSPAADDGSGHLMMAMVLATLHLVTGATAFAQGFVLTNPEAFALRTARWAHRNLPAQLAEAEALTTRLAHNLGTRLQVIAEAEQAAETARQTRRAVAAHVRAATRLRVAQHLGRPEDTGLVRQPPDRPIPGVD